MQINIMNKIYNIFANFPLLQYILVIVQFIIIFLHFIESPLHDKKLFFEEIIILNKIGDFIILICLGIILISIKTLNKNISPLPIPLRKSKLVTKGIYSKFRHPIYYSLLVISFIFLIKTLSAYNLILTILLCALIFLKIKLEENYLNKKFIEYKKYKRKVRF